LNPDLAATSHAADPTRATDRSTRSPARLREAAADRAILSLASRQHWVVNRAQLLRAGLSAETVARRVRSGFLRPIHRGVYVVAVAATDVTPRMRAMAAVLACDGRAPVGQQTADALWSSAASLPERIDLILASGGRRRPGIRFHRIESLRPDEVTELDGIPITTPARTLLDIAAIVPAREFDSAVVEALGSRRTTLDELKKLLDVHPRHPGSSRLRKVLRADGPAATRSQLEKRFMALVDEAGLAKPEVNVVVEGYRVDFVWRAEMLIVETDGLAYHSTDDRFETDRRRDRVLVVAG
jgi:hypothetical protein